MANIQLNTHHRLSGYQSKIISINITISLLLLLLLFFPPSGFSLLSSGCSLCCLPQFAPTASRKTRAAKNILSALRALRSTRVDVEEVTRVNFTRRRTEVTFPSADWLSYLRTQLTAFVGGVCLRSKKIFSALFSRNNFFTRWGHFKELQVKGICSIALKFGQ